MRHFKNLFQLLAMPLLAACTSKLPKPYPYEATTPDKRLVIFGTIHVGVPESEIAESVHKELRRSTLAFFEADLSSFNSAPALPVSHEERAALLRQKEID